MRFEESGAAYDAIQGQHWVRIFSSTAKETTTCHAGLCNAYQIVRLQALNADQ
jgi:hypothetical protein